MLQTPPDTIRHGPDTTRHHHTCIMYGLYGLKHHIVEISGDVTDAGRDGTGQTTSKDRATQLLICEPLSSQFTVTAQLPRIVLLVYSSIWPMFRKSCPGFQRPLPSGEVWQQFPRLSQISITARQLLASSWPLPVLIAIVDTCSPDGG